MRKAQDDPIARTAAENQLGDALDAAVGDTSGDTMAMARELLGEFKAVEFETTVRKVGTEQIHLRRLVLTGAWEVDPNAK